MALRQPPTQHPVFLKPTIPIPPILCGPPHPGALPPDAPCPRSPLSDISWHSFHASRLP